VIINKESNLNTAQFQKSVNFNAEPIQTKRSPHAVLDDLETAIAKVRVEAVGLGMMANELDGVIDRLINEAEKNWMRTQYATLDLSFTESFRKVLVGPEGEKIVAKAWDVFDGEVPKGHAWFALPTYVTHWDEFSDIVKSYHLGSREDDGWYRRDSPFHRCNLGTIERWRVGNEHHRAVNVEARLEIPSGMNQACLNAIRQAITFRELFALALFMRGISNSRMYADRHANDVGILWAPVETAWAFQAKPVRPKGDPAILLQGRKGSAVYLIGFFDTPNEKPIENIVREFSEGTMPKKSKTKKK
jgi:hypothetical protein